MKRMTATVGAVAIAILATACAQKSADSGDAAKSAGNVAVVDGYKITRAMYDQFVNTISNGAAGLSEQQRKGLLENLISGQILAKEAEVKGVDKQAKYRGLMELQRLNILGQAAKESFLRGKEATEAEMKAEYEKRLSTMDKKQYRVSHVLVKTEAEAAKIIAQLNAGGNFAAIASAQSQDTGSKVKGGDLDWISPASTVPEFAKAVTSLGKGQTFAAPVKTEFGYHVIRVVDIRDFVPPTFEQVKDEMKRAVDGAKLKAWVEELTRKAKVTRSL